MSGGSTLSSCCPSTVTDVLVCPKPCEFAPLNCADSISVAIQSILDLKQTSGSTADDIYTYAQTICPGVTLTDIDNALIIGARRGIFKRIFGSIESTPTYMIIGRMPLFNYQNKNYNRIPCTYGSFWTSTSNGN